MLLCLDCIEKLKLARARLLGEEPCGVFGCEEPVVFLLTGGGLAHFCARHWDDPTLPIR
jgi:hypothetical protein